MEKRTFCKRFMLWTAIIAAIILCIINVASFKIVEANMFEEVSKRVLMGFGVIGILEVFAYTLSGFFYHLIYDKKEK